MFEKLRDPKWLSIACAAVVVVGMLAKMLASDASEEAAPRAAKRVAKGAAPELGRYELARSSWAAQREDEDAPAASPEMPKKRKDRRWNGLTVAFQKDN